MNLWQGVRHNLGLKALSLFLAVVLWLLAGAGVEREASISVPVLLENVPAGLVVTGNPPKTIDVRLRGANILLWKSRMVNPVLLLDLKGTGAGTTSFPSLTAMINVPQGVRVTRVTPAVIEINLTRGGTTGTGPK